MQAKKKPSIQQVLRYLKLQVLCPLLTFEVSTSYYLQPTIIFGKGLLDFEVQIFSCEGYVLVTSIKSHELNNEFTCMGRNDSTCVMR
jgi:hypothetical protein